MHLRISLCLSNKGGIIIHVGSQEYNENIWVGKNGENGKTQIVAQYPLPGLHEAFLAKLAAFLHFACRCHHKMHAMLLPGKCLRSFSFCKLGFIVIRISHCCTLSLLHSFLMHTCVIYGLNIWLQNINLTGNYLSPVLFIIFCLKRLQKYIDSIYVS